MMLINWFAATFAGWSNKNLSWNDHKESPIPLLRITWRPRKEIYSDTGVKTTTFPVDAYTENMTTHSGKGRHATLRIRYFKMRRFPAGGGRFYWFLDMLPCKGFAPLLEGLWRTLLDTLKWTPKNNDLPFSLTFGPPTKNASFSRFFACFARWPFLPSLNTTSPTPRTPQYNDMFFLISRGYHCTGGSGGGGAGGHVFVGPEGNDLFEKWRRLFK